MKEQKIGSMITVLLVSATLLSACSKINLPTLLVMDPATSNTLTITLPTSMGGGKVTSNLVGNVNTTVTIDTNKLISAQGTPATVVVNSFSVAGSELNLGGLKTGTLCTYIPAGEEAGGIAYLEPLITRSATFTLTIPTETKAVDPNVQALIPPIALLITVDAKAKIDLMGLINLVFKGTGLSIHQVSNLTIPTGIPLLAGSAVVMDAVLTSTKTPVTDAKLDECTAMLTAK